MGKVNIQLANANQAVGVGGYTGAGVEIPRLDLGNGRLNGQVVNFKFRITKTAGGNVDPNAERLEIQKSSDGTTWHSIYPTTSDGTPINFLAGKTGATAEGAFDMIAVPGDLWRPKLTGDGVADTWTIEHMSVSVG